MIGRQALAWVAAALTAAIVYRLVLRRALPMATPEGRYRRLEKATLIATAIFVGVLTGLGVFLLLSRMGD